MKSILFLSVMNGSSWGGSEEQWNSLALWMTKMNFQVEVSCFNWPEKNDKIAALKNAGIKLMLLPSRNKGLIAKWTLQKLVNKIQFENYDLVFINQGGFEDVTHSPFKTIYKRCKKYIISSHNYSENGNLSTRRSALLQKWFRHSCLNIGASQKIFDTLESHYKIPVPNQKIIYSPITFSVPDKVAFYPSTANKPIIFTMLAALEVDRKAQDILIKVFATKKWKARNWQLHLYGVGKDKALLENIITENELKDSVLLKGHTNDVKNILTNTHIYLQITKQDAMPISVMEAMATGRPCIVSKVGDMPVWVQHGQNGYVCSSVTEGAIDSVLETAWQQQEHWEIMGQQSFSKFQELYPHPYEERIVTIMQTV